jgi:phosphohistidine phosphatase
MTERRIYIIRHAIAEDVSSTGRDEDRALTPEGRKKMKRAARGLAALDVAPARLLSSPLVRAWQTAEIVIEALPQLKIETCDLLAPGVDERSLTRLLDGVHAGVDVALVGHEPDLGEVLSYWLTGSRGGVETRFKKGAVACISSSTLPPIGKAVLEWMMTAGQLGAIEPGR